MAMPIGCSRTQGWLVIEGFPNVGFVRDMPGQKLSYADEIQPPNDAQPKTGSLSFLLLTAVETVAISSRSPDHVPPVLF